MVTFSKPIYGSLSLIGFLLISTSGFAASQYLFFLFEPIKNLIMKKYINLYNNNNVTKN